MDAKEAHPCELEEVQAVGPQGRRGIAVTTFSARGTTDTSHIPGYERSTEITTLMEVINYFVVCYVWVFGDSADFPFWF